MLGIPCIENDIGFRNLPNVSQAPLNQKQSYLTQMPLLLNKNIGRGLAFTEVFEPKRGDILYGLTEVRQSYLTKYGKALYEKDMAESMQAYAEDMSEYLVEKSQLLLNNPELTEKDIEQRLFKPNLCHDGYHSAEEAVSEIFRYHKVLSRDYFNKLIQSPLPSAQKTEEIQIDWSKHTALDSQFLQQWKNSDQAKKFNAVSLKQLQKANTDLQTIDINSDKTLDALYHLVARRACKFVLEFVVQQKKGHVHFLLDHLEMPCILNQTTHTLPLQTKGIPITTSELRFIFRKWGEWKKNQQTHQISFYKQNTSVNPPWIDDPKAWCQIAQKRIYQHQALLQKTAPLELAQFNNSLNQQRFEEALNIFFSLKI